MSTHTAALNLVNEFNRVWSSEFPRMTTLMDNQEPASPMSNTWVRFSVQFDEEEPSGISRTNQNFRQSGQIAFVINARIGSGIEETVNIVDIIKANFRHRDIEGIVLRTTQVGVSSKIDNWWSTLVTIPFYFDNIEADT